MCAKKERKSVFGHLKAEVGELGLILKMASGPAVRNMVKVAVDGNRVKKYWGRGKKGK